MQLLDRTGAAERIEVKSSASRLVCHFGSASLMARLEVRKFDICLRRFNSGTQRAEASAMRLFKIVLMLAWGLVQSDAQDTSLRTMRAFSPAHPVNTVAAGIVVVEVEQDRSTRALDTRILFGDSPFLPAALTALARWRFENPSGVPKSRTSVTFLFRSPAMFPMKIGTGPIRPWSAAGDSSALPQEIIDPGYPPASIASGAVILEVQLDAAGHVADVQTISGIASLTEKAATAVKGWRFSPATISGKAVPSTAVVVISFVLPM
jgi:TonB family protein